MTSLDQKPAPKVAGPLKTGKYVGIIVIAIIAAIIGQNFIRHSNKTAVSPTTTIQTADTAAIKVDLGGNSPQYPVLPPAAIQLPKTLPPPDLITQAEDAQDQMTRLKSPSLVYSANQTSSSSSNNNQSSGGNSNQSFGDQLANAKVTTVQAKQLTNPDYKILQGKFIPAVLETAINSDLPGMVRAVIDKDVYGETGSKLLLPKGTRLIGQYNSSVAVGQTRVYIMWTRAITPDDVDIALGSPSTNALGEAGMGGIVDTHFWKVFGTSMLLSVLGASASNYASNSNTSTGAYGNPYQMAVTQGMLNNSSAMLQTNVSIQPTIHVQQGSLIEVFVARDLDFSGVMGGNQ